VLLLAFLCIIAFLLVSLVGSRPIRLRSGFGAWMIPLSVRFILCASFAAERSKDRVPEKIVILVVSKTFNTARY